MTLLFGVVSTESVAATGLAGINIESLESAYGYDKINSWRVLQELAAEIKLKTTNLEKLSKYITEEGADLTKLQNSLKNAKDPQKWIDMKIPQKELDDIFEVVANDPPHNLTPWTREHKAQRWRNYKAGKEAGENSGQNFETWSNGYDGKIDVVTNAKKGVDDYFESLDWDCPASSCREKTLSVDLDGSEVNRRLDIYDELNLRGKEFKEYSSGKVYRSKDIVSEVMRDKQLLETSQLLEMEWVFKGCEPSGPLKALLESSPNPITIVYLPK